MKEKGEYKFKGKRLCKKRNENSLEGRGLNDRILRRWKRKNKRNKEGKIEKVKQPEKKEQ